MHGVHFCDCPCRRNYCLVADWNLLRREEFCQGIPAEVSIRNHLNCSSVEEYFESLNIVLFDKIKPCEIRLL